MAKRTGRKVAHRVRKWPLVEEMLMEKGFYLRVSWNQEYEEWRENTK